jgi:hypothetical protein
MYILKEPPFFLIASYSAFIDTVLGSVVVISPCKRRKTYFMCYWEISGSEEYIASDFARK